MYQSQSLLRKSYTFSFEFNCFNSNTEMLSFFIHAGYYTICTSVCLFISISLDFSSATHIKEIFVIVDQSVHVRNSHSSIYGKFISRVWKSDVSSCHNELIDQEVILK